MKPQAEAIRQRIASLIERRFGRVDEELVRAGILDSLRTIELALDLEREFGIRIDQLTLQDIQTLTSLSERLVELGTANGL